MLPPLGTRKAVLFFALAVTFSAETGAQTLNLQGSESSPIGSLNGDQVLPSVSVGPTGGILVWEGAGTERTISAVRLNADFSAAGEVIRVNELVVPTRKIKPLIGDRERPQVIQLKEGGWLFVWEIRRGPHAGLYSRVLGTNDAFLTNDIRITPSNWTINLKRATNWYGCFRDRWKSRRFKFREVITHVRENAGGASAIALPDGGALVVYAMNRSVETNTWTLSRTERWTGRRYSTNDVLVRVRYRGDWMQEIYVQRLDATGNRVGEAIQVNQQSDYNQRNPSLAALANGGFAAVWVSESPRGSQWEQWTQWTNTFRVQVVGRVLDSNGGPVGGEFLVGDDDGLNQANPEVAGLVDGGFTVLWSQQESALSRRWDVRGRAFGADGSPVAASFTVNAYTDGDQFAPKISSSGSTQLAVWTSVGQDGSREGIYGRLLTGGVPSSPELRINTTTISRQIQPTVGTDGAGRFLAIWSGFVGESGFDLQGQKLVTDNAAPSALNR